MKRKCIYFFIIPAVIALFNACSKDAGEGGNSSIFGKVHVKDYNATFTVLTGEYDAQDEDVFIIYGDDITYSDHVSTNYDGVYQFKYLRPGKYTLFVYSKDSAQISSSGDIEVRNEVEITKKNQDVEVPEMIIFN